jgi:hypothetical protein
MEARTRPCVIIEGELYKHGVCSPLLKCLSRTEGQELMKEIHAGLCGAHIESRPLLGKVFRQGFYWPKAASDAVELVQKCEKCQRCARDQKQPSSLTQLIQPTWPLQRWGLDLLGPLPPAQGNLKYVVVAVEYFSIHPYRLFCIVFPSLSPNSKMRIRSQLTILTRLYFFINIIIVYKCTIK